MGIARSFWLGKFVIYNGLYKGRKENESMRERSSLEIDRLPKEGGPGEHYSSISSLEMSTSAMPPVAEDHSIT
jgi:hypothetical protein